MRQPCGLTKKSLILGLSAFAILFSVPPSVAAPPYGTVTKGSEATMLGIAEVVYDKTACGDITATTGKDFAIHIPINAKGEPEIKKLYTTGYIKFNLKNSLDCARLAVTHRGEKEKQ